MKIDIPSSVNNIIKKLEERGYEAYAVGGCVRDSVMGKEPNDWDICTSALPEETLLCLDKDNIIKNGIKHGTVTVRVDGENYEITTFRTDGEYTDNRHPESVTFVRDLNEDLSRRDFTINALAYSEERGLQDNFHGIDDIDNKIIRCVGSPDRRFGEDALRILRALRFSSVLGFDIEKRTAKSIHKNAYLLKNISKERIMSEFIKILEGKNVEAILLEYSDVIAEIVPEIKPMIGFEQHNPHHVYDVWTHTVKVVSGIRAEKELRLAAFFHDIGKPSKFVMDENGIGHFHGHPEMSAVIAERALKRLKSDNKTIANVCRLIKFHDVRPFVKKSIRRLMAQSGMELFPHLLELKRADAKAQSEDYLKETLEYIDFLEEMYNKERENNNDFTLKMLKINGQDLKDIGITNGREIGYCLNQLLIKVIDEEIENKKDILLEYAEKMDKNICKS